VDLHRTDETIPSSAVRVSKTVVLRGGVRLDSVVQRPTLLTAHRSPSTLSATY